MERATRHVHAKLEAEEAERARRRGAREAIDLLTLDHGIPEPVPGRPGWLAVGWIVRHGHPGWWDVLVEVDSGRVQVRRVARAGGG